MFCAASLFGYTVGVERPVGVSRRTVDMPPGVQAQIERLLVPLDYRGPCVANYKLAADGTARIFEINPRFGGSLLRRPQVDLLREALGHLLAAAR